MGGTSSKTHIISFRLSNEAYSEYERLIKGARNPHESVGKMIKWVAEWFPFRHTTRKYRHTLLDKQNKGCYNTPLD